MPDISSVAALVADPTRGRMLSALMGGRALTATELALEGEVTASTASSHLARLAAAGIVTATRQGRHRYYRLAAPEIASAIEALVTYAARSNPRPVHTGPRDPALRRARVCYDHLAGEAAVQLLAKMREKDLLGGDDDALTLTRRGEAWCDRAGIDLGALKDKRRPLCRSCLDWSERRMHLAGALGSALLDRLFALRYARRDVHSRAVFLSSRGESFVHYLELHR
jgi:DNA-binding transcriptional ArsR family regulator